MSDADILITMLIAAFWVPAILLLIYKAANKRGASIVTGEVIDINPRYRTVIYTCKVQFDGSYAIQQFRSRTIFTRYRMGDSVKFYLVEVKDGIKLYTVNGYYGIVYYLILVPLLAVLLK